MPEESLEEKWEELAKRVGENGSRSIPSQGAPRGCKQGLRGGGEARHSLDRRVHTKEPVWYSKGNREQPVGRNRVFLIF